MGQCNLLLTLKNATFKNLTCQKYTTQMTERERDALVVHEEEETTELIRVDG